MHGKQEIILFVLMLPPNHVMLLRYRYSRAPYVLFYFHGNFFLIVFLYLEAYSATLFY